MAAHAATTAPAPLLPTPGQRPGGSTIRRPALRPLLWLVVASALVLLAANVGAVEAAASSACTYGTEPGTTCGEALWLLGFPD